MATENYGVTARQSASQASTPISTDTVIVFIGDSTSGADSTPVWCSSMSSYKSHFGNDGTLLEAAHCVFDLVGIRGAYSISALKDGAAATSAELIGAIEEGIPQIFMDHGDVATIGVVLGGPDVATKNVVLTLSNALKHTSVGDGKFNGIVYYDGDSSEETSEGKKLDIANDRCVCNVDDVIISMSAGSVTEKASGAAYKACLLAAADVSQDGHLPCRTIGNLYCPNILGVCDKSLAKITRLEEDATELSADGITSWINSGGGKYYTWGDHTSAYANNAVADELGRFDSNVRMLNHLKNRAMLKYKVDIDSPMTPQLRNDILTSENRYLAYCVSVGALIGSPRCVFTAVDNTSETLQKGEFYFEELCTVTPPSKFIDFNFVFTSEGFSVYLINE
jgi:hypothetical protein